MSGKAKSLLLSMLLASTPLSGVLAQPEDVAASAQASVDDLEGGFRVPPQSARPRVWWHWMNGNVTQAGIAQDLAWMQRVGIGGMQNFDVDLDTAQIVDERLVYMTPAWRDAFRFAAEEAARRDLELAIASSPGWSLTGGPWVSPEDALKKLVWSETVVEGGQRVTAQLAQPPANAGPFQAVPQQATISDLIAGHEPAIGPSFYRDVRVLAVPTAGGSDLPVPLLTDGQGHPLEHVAHFRDAAVRDVALPAVISGVTPELRMDYGGPVTVRSATIQIPGGAVTLIGPILRPTLQISDDGQEWTDLVSFTLQEPPTTVSFPAATARHFRVIVRPAIGGGEASPDEQPPAQELAMEDRFGTMFAGLLGRPVTIGEFQLRSEPRIDQFEVKAAFSLTPDYFALPQIGDNVMAPSPESVIDVTQFVDQDGKLEWTAPAGTWRILRLGYALLGKTNHPAPAEATGLEVDKFDGDAVERYLEHYLETYRQTVGDESFGERGVQALLTDSIEIGAANWTPRMIEQFQRLRGYDPVPWLPTLTGIVIGSREDSDRFLFDFRRTLADLMASEHYRTVADVAHRHGLQVYGEALEGNRGAAIGDDMSMRRYADFPMAAMWAFDQSDGPPASYVTDIRGAASVASLYGQNIVAAESMTVGMAPWAFGPTQLKHIVDQEFLLGVNRPVVHTSVHVPLEDRQPGLSLGGIGQFFNRNESWAELARPWVDYLSRNSFLLQQGRNVADVAYFYGEEAPVSGLHGTGQLDDVPTRFAYDFVNAEALVDALRNDGDALVSLGGARYRAIYLGGSSDHMSVPTLRRLASLAGGGATIIGNRPLDRVSLGDDPAEFAELVALLWSGSSSTTVGEGRVIATDDLDAALGQLGLVPDFSYASQGSAAPVAYRHRALADGHIYFLVNQSDAAVTIDGQFRVSGFDVELWNPETGERNRADFVDHGDRTSVPILLQPRDAIHVVFGPAGAPGQALRTYAAANQFAPIEGPWQVTFQEGRGAPPSAEMTQLSALNESDDTGIRHFSGMATYTTTFQPPAGWRPGDVLRLDLGEMHEVAEIRINGEHAGYSWHAPHIVDIGHLVRPDVRNELEVRVANLWVNRLIGDAAGDPADAVAWTSVPTYLPTAQLRPSGLIGPVVLQSVTSPEN